MRKHKLLPVLLPLIAGIAPCFNTAAQSPETRQLEPGVSVERELAGGDEHRYRVALTAGQHVSFQIVKRGIDVTPELKGPSGQSLFTADFETSERGTEIISLVAQTAGQHTLIIKPKYGKSRPARYAISIDQPREASEQDRRRFAAQQIFVEADRLFKQETDEARREARKKLAESLPVWRSIGDRVWEARTLHQMGFIHYWLTDYKAALDHYNQSLELRRADGDKFGEAETLRAIGEVYTFQEEVQKAIEYCNQALVLQQALNEQWHSAGTFFALARAYWFLYENEKAGYNYVQSRDLYREAGDSGNEATTLADLGMMQIIQGDFQSALDNVRRSLALYRAEKSRYGEVAALHHLGDIYHNLGEPEKAFEYYNQALPILREIENPYAESYVLTSMGIVYNSMGDQRNALAHLNKSLPLCRKVQDRRCEAGTLRYIGKVYREMGDLPKALEHLDQTLRITRELNDPHNEGGALATIGEIYAEMGEHQNAIEYLNRSLKLRRVVMNRRGEATTLYALAAVERDRGKLPEARAYVEEAIRIIESLRARVVGTELRQSYFAAQQGSYELSIDLLMRLHEQSPETGHDALALQTSERARARSLLESLVEAGADIRQGADPSLLDRERSLRQQLNAREERRIRLLSGKHTPEQAAEADREVNALLAEYQQARAQIRAASPRYAALTQPRPLELKEIQAQLDDETLLLVYSLGAKRSFLWAVTPTTVKSYVLPTRDQIEKDARRFHELLEVSPQRKSLAEIKRRTERLSEMLLGQAAGQLTRKRLVIVADGALQSIPFATLTQPGGKRPLITEREIVNLPSVSALAQLRRDVAERSPAPKTIAVIADPVFEANDKRIKTKAGRAASATPDQADLLAAVTRSARDAGLTGFRRLPFSRREADQITSLVPPAMHSRIVDFEASRATLDRTDLSQYRILHFATHGLLNDKNAELSGIVLSLYDQQGQPQDGFLRAHEIYNLKLNADLVVLSACQTALGKDVRGEGLIGMSRGFMYAGAPRLVVSLWKVNDQATAELMKRFYNGMIREKLRPAAALRAAQAAMAQEPRWRAPNYWAGFILQGEWR